VENHWKTWKCPSEKWYMFWNKWKNSGITGNTCWKNWNTFWNTWKTSENVGISLEYMEKRGLPKAALVQPIHTCDRSSGRGWG
jgi:hypothetical protein